MMDMGKQEQLQYKSPVVKIYEKFSKHKDVSLVFGKPVELDDKKVLPVAKFRYIVGGGGGYSRESEKNPTTQGEGGGGHFSVKPVGVYEITAENVKFKPIKDFNLMMILFLLVLIGLFWVLRTRMRS